MSREVSVHLIRIPAVSTVYHTNSSWCNHQTCSFKPSITVKVKKYTSKLPIHHGIRGRVATPGTKMRDWTVKSGTTLLSPTMAPFSSSLQDSEHVFTSYFPQQPVIFLRFKKATSVFHTLNLYELCFTAAQSHDAKEWAIPESMFTLHSSLLFHLLQDMALAVWTYWQPSAELLPPVCWIPHELPKWFCTGSCRRYIFHG